MKLFRIPQWSSSSEHSDSPDSPPSVAPSVAPTRSGTLTTLSRSRSRSLSVSLTQEAEAKRAGSKRRVLQREVSMSKVFKGKRRDSDVREAVREPPLVKAAEPQGPVILVAGTPMKPKKGKASANGRIGGIGAAKVLVAGTPAKTGGSRASAIASEDDGDESDDVAMPRWPGV
ncbi:hypothetical protein BV25DRAFT_1827699 [Artomyces pyxidatus]|uniref:Uncharacterized protein n=1 Tax=Artomyces pyxidatus TaxID=48021 RepID=A0ACB8SWB0_9AGAM|nr:hypothetical protein BV25DRAFT_1827699 [Artomyces pyxidatus]